MRMSICYGLFFLFLFCAICMKKLKQPPGGFLFLSVCACVAALGLFVIIAAVLLRRPFTCQKAGVEEAFTAENCSDLQITPYEVVADGQDPEEPASCQTRRFYLGGCASNGSGAAAIKKHNADYDPQADIYTNWRVVQLSAAEVRAATGDTSSQITDANTTYLRIQRRSGRTSNDFLYVDGYPTALRANAAAVAARAQHMFFMPQYTGHWCAPSTVPTPVAGLTREVSLSGALVIDRMWNADTRQWANISTKKVSAFSQATNTINAHQSSYDNMVIKVQKPGPLGWRVDDIIELKSSRAGSSPMDCLKYGLVSFMTPNADDVTAAGAFKTHAVCPVLCIDRNAATVTA